MIRFISSALTAFLVVAGLLGSAGRAQSQGGRPWGDYQQTCRDVNYNGSILTANCQKRDGGWRSSSLDYRNCRGQVINDDGHLRCGQGGSFPGGSAGVGGLPRGDYKLTCNNMRMEGNRLVANCEKRDGGWRTSKVDNAYQCHNIVNDDGRLVCSR
jgi:CVNH domain